MTSHPICPIDDIAENTSAAFEVAGLSVLLCRSNGTLYAVENRCSHQATELTGGRVRRGYVACPLHGVMFNLSNGEPVGTLTRTPIRTFAVQVEDGIAHIQVDDDQQPA